MSNLRDVQEAVLIFVLLIYRGHERSGRGQDLVDKDEDGLLRRKLNPLADHVDELAHCEVCGNQVLLLVDGRDVRLLDLLADDLRLLAAVRHHGGIWMTYGNAVVVLLTDALGLSLALLEGVLVLELGAHLGGIRGCGLCVEFPGYAGRRAL
jgi:hypothetical protein